MSEQSGISATEVRSLAETLRRRQRDLASRVDRIEAQHREPLDDDSEEQATQREDEESTDVLERVSLSEIAAIALALRRIEAGTYGLCLSCGQSIGSARLQAVPEAALCIHCAAGILDS